MKKLKLLLAFCALLLGWSNASAQKDVTSQYITNATLSDGTNGWTKTFTKTKETNDPADAFSNSVRGNNTVGYASEAYAGYGSLIQTAYSMKQTITLPAGNYRLVCYAFFRQGDANDESHNTKSLAYLKAGDKSVLIKTLRSITAAGYANSQAEGANCFDSKMYRNVVEFTSDGTPIEIGVDGTFDEARSWCIVGQFELFDLNQLASVSSPTDVTYAITNSSFEYRDLTGWTNNGLKYQNNSWANKTGIGFAEQWANGVALGSSKSMTQTLTNMPAGLYELSVYAHNIEQYNSDAAGTGMFLTANSDKVEISAYGQYKVRTTLASDGDITIGINLDNCTGNWIAFDRFGLQFYGDPLEAYKDLLASKVAQAQALAGTIPTAAASALQTVVDANDNDDDAFTTEEQFNTAISNIEAAMSSATACVAPYAAFNALKAKANTLQAVANTNAEANSTLAAAISAQTTAADAATTAEGIATATAALKTAMTTYVGAADPTSGNRFDLTFMLTNPDLTGLPTWQSAAGWASEETDGNSQVMVNDSKTVGDKSYFYEYWSGTAKASGKFALYNAVTLPAGTYTMSCYAFAEDQNTQSTVNGVYFYANDTQGSCVTSTSLAEQSISFINDEEQEVKIGLKTLTGNTRNWMGIGYVELYKEYTDNTTYNITATINDGDVAITVDGVAATSAKALKTVTLTASNLTEGYAVGNVTATYNDGELKNLDVANPSENVYTYQQPAYDVTVTMNVVVDKRGLNTAIASATAARKSANEGAGVFQIPAAAGTTLANAITTAQGVYDNASATVSQVADAVTAISEAKTTYEGATLNAPDAETRYYLTVATSGHAKENNAIVVTLGATSNNNKTGYGFAAAAEPKTYMAQALIFTQVSENNYKISVERPEGMVYLTYGSLNNSAAGWAEQQIQGTTDASAAGEFKIVATATANVFNIYNTVYNDYIDCQDGGSLYTDTNIDMKDFTLTEASQASVDIKIDANVKYATRIFPFVPELPSGVKAYSCAASEGNELTLVEVEKGDLAANVPYILEAESGCNKTLQGWGTAGATSYTTGWLTGVYESTTATAGTYVLQNNNDKVAFYLVVAGEEPTVGANRCYLTIPAAGARAAFFFPGSITGVNNVAAAAEAEVKDGKYIENGKVVIVKNGKKFSATGAQMK